MSLVPKSLGHNCVRSTGATAQITYVFFFSFVGSSKGRTDSDSSENDLLLVNLILTVRTNR